MNLYPAKNKKSPIESNPLRYPGQSIDEKIEDIWEGLLKSFYYAAAAIAMTILVWAIWLSQKPVTPWSMTIFCALVLTFTAIKFIRDFRTIQRLKMARDGEMFVGQFLDDLRARGYQVFHDIRGQDFNLDHVVLSPQGFYIVETKTLSKPIKGKAEIYIKDDQVIANGYTIERNPLTQARAEAKWLKDFLQSSAGKQFPIKPVIVFPGWFVHPQNENRDVWVLNPKALPSFIAHERQSIAQEDVYLAAYHLARYIKSK